jgi:hypothetical protein
MVVFSVGILLAVVPFDTGNFAGFLYLFYSLSKRETETESLDTPAVEFLWGRVFAVLYYNKNKL